MTSVPFEIISASPTVIRVRHPNGQFYELAVNISVFRVLYQEGEKDTEGNPAFQLKMQFVSSPSFPAGVVIEQQSLVGTSKPEGGGSGSSN